jgi:hypothetical protein
MTVFNVHSGVLVDYCGFVRSFFSVADDCAREFIDRELLKLGTWFSFTRRKQARVELYLDAGEREANRRCFDELLAHRASIEAIVGEPLKWERLDDKRACRIAAYNRAQILTDSDSPALLDWAVKKAVDFHRAFAPEFIQRAGRNQETS